jgi:hypothetical protein
MLREAIDIRFGSLADIRAVNCDVCFTSEANICPCERHVRFVPIADIARLA